MTRYPQTISLTAVVMLAVSCSLPVLKQAPLLATDPGEATAQRSSVDSKTDIDFHRVPTSAPCPRGGCRTPTLKTLAVDYQPTADVTGPPQWAPANLLNQPRSAAASPVAASTKAAVQTSERELNVYFAYADATLPQEARMTLSAALRDRASLHRISIRGRTDGLGASPANQRLALSRANAVRQHLLERDPSLATIIEVEARGSCCYIAPNATASGRALNRRVEITFVHRDSDA